MKTAIALGNLGVSSTITVQRITLPVRDGFKPVITGFRLIVDALAFAGVAGGIPIIDSQLHEAKRGEIVGFTSLTAASFISNSHVLPVSVGFNAGYFGTLPEGVGSGVLSGRAVYLDLWVVTQPVNIDNPLGYAIIDWEESKDSDVEAALSLARRFTNP